MRPCPNCECFVPEAARRCPRCEATLAPIPAPEPVVAEVNGRELVLVGAGSRPTPLTGSAHTETAPASVYARVALPPLDGPAGAPRRPALPKLPQPFAPDPLVLAVFLGIPVRETAPPEPTVDAPPAEATAPAPAPPEPTVDAPRAAAIAPDVVAPTPAKLPADAFSLLLGTGAPAATPAAVPDDLLPIARATTPTPAPAPAPAPAPTIVAVPIAAAGPTIQPLPARRRFRRDPFARRSSRRERLLTRVCASLAVTLLLVIVALRLPTGVRPRLEVPASGDSSSVSSAPATTALSPFADAIRVQTRADLQAAIESAQRVYGVFTSYVPANPVILGRAAPQFAFIPGTTPSHRLGQLSVTSSAHAIVFSEYAGPDACVYARVSVHHHAEIAPGIAGTECRATVAPEGGWSSLAGA